MSQTETQQQSDELDRLLTGFFQSERPATWPAVPQIHEAAPAGRSFGNSLRSSRFVLAISLAFVLVGGWLLSGRLSRPADRAGSFDDTTATRPSFRLPADAPKPMP